MAFEKRFGAGEDIGPIKVNVGDKTVLLRGIIDRMDILDTGSGQDAVDHTAVIDGQQHRPKMIEIAFAQKRHKSGPRFKFGFSGGTSG